MALGEVYQALMNGVIDGQENTWSTSPPEVLRGAEHITETTTVIDLHGHPSTRAGGTPAPGHPVPD